MASCVCCCPAGWARCAALARRLRSGRRARFPIWGDSPAGSGQAQRCQRCRFAAREHLHELLLTAVPG